MLSGNFKNPVLSIAVALSNVVLIYTLKDQSEIILIEFWIPKSELPESELVTILERDTSEEQCG